MRIQVAWREARALVLVGVVASLPTALWLDATPAAASDSSMVMFNVSNDPIKFTDSHTVLVPGTWVNGVCHLVVPQLTRRLGEPRVGAQEIGRDLQSCAELVREGHVDASTLPVPDLYDPTKHGADPCSDEFFGWYDNQGIRLVDVDTSGCWSYDGTYVYGCSGSSTDYKAPDGWYNTFWSGTDIGFSQDQSQCFAYIASNYENDVFCGFQSTYIYYDPNKLVMEANGSVANGTTSWDGGACTFNIHWWSNH